MSVGVVDLLEAIDVEEDEREGCAAACLLREGGIDLGDDRAVIGEPRQRIGAGLLREQCVRLSEFVAQQACLA
jgi:hypothetical protein